MLSQDDMEDFMAIEAAVAEQDEVSVKPEEPFSADPSSIKRHQAPDPLEAVRSLLAAGNQVSELLAQVTGKSRN